MAAGTVVWAAGTAAWAAGTAAWAAGTEANKDRTDGAMEQRSAANFERGVLAAVAASKKVTKKVRSPNDRRRRMVPHVGIDLPSAPESCGPVGCAFERWGRTLHTAPVSTMNCCLMSSSCKKNHAAAESI